jgi:hypothetical protein
LIHAGIAHAFPAAVVSSVTVHGATENKPQPKQKKPGRRKKRKRGGQSGHQQQLREPLPPERVDETIDYEIDDGEVQRLGLTPNG